MVKLLELNQYTDEFLQSKLVADNCPNGLQIEGQQEIRCLASAVTASLKTIEAAVTLGAQALVVHHGLFWNGDSYVISGSKYEKIRLLIKNGISLLSYHLPLDMNQQVGNNWKAAQDMGWKDLQPFGSYKGMFIGVQGRIPATPRDELQKQLEKYYQHSAFCALGGKENVQSVALISGGAYRSISEAGSAGIDCFITGNFDEPAWHLAHEEKVNFYALGHSATERIGPKALGEHLSQKFNLEHRFIDIPNPF
jgi:dinuclear metal center YbgI/SA1388 family protein